MTCSTPGAVRKAVLEAEPDAIVHEATALADCGFAARKTASLTNQWWSETRSHCRQGESLSGREPV